MKHIPNFITSLNLAAGFIAIIFVVNGDIVTASWFVVAAMIFDFLDGLSARLLNAYSSMGKELDSLADLVSFGVVPGLIIYQLLNISLSLSSPYNISSDGFKVLLLWITPVIIPVCAALRLAKFNIDTSQATTFKGLPTPANALAVITIVFAGHYSPSTVFSFFTGSAAILIVFSLLLSLLMISRIPLLSLKVRDLKIKGNEGRYILAGSVLLSFAILGISAAPLIIPLYILVSLISRIF